MALPLPNYLSLDTLYCEGGARNRRRCHEEAAMKPRYSTLLGVTGVLFGASLQMPSRIGAQERTASVRGRVLDRATSVGLRQAEISIPAVARLVRTDSDGLFTLNGLSSGSVDISVRALGFRAVQVLVDLKPGEVIERTIALDSTGTARKVQELPAVAVQDAAPLSYRLADFERRRRTGRGHYLTDGEIRASGANTLQGAVRGIRGVEFDCRADAVCRIHMARAPNNCDPDYVVDSRVDNMFGPTTPIRDIVGLEIYSGPSDVPGEFAGRNAGCGVIVIWTRFGPAGKQH